MKNLSKLFLILVAGVLVVLGMMVLDKAKVDDPVGAWPVHGLCGIWGGVAAGLFGGHPIGAQLAGSLIIPVWAFATMYVVFSALKSLDMLRVSEEEELKGLDISEHEMESYAGFELKQ